MDMEATVMELIINAGESRSLAMQALQAARKGVWQDVDRLMQDAAVWGGDRLCMDGSSSRKQREALRGKA